MQALRLTLRQLQIFRAVADSGTTSAAARTIALSQSATSAAIHELERLLDLRLFDRIGKRLLLNDNGRALLPQALGLLEGAGAIERWAQHGPGQIGELRLGASTTIGNYLLPGILAEFQRSLPSQAREGWRVQVTIANTGAIVDQVSSLSLDIGFIEGPCHQSDLTVRPWLQDELVVVAAPSDRLHAGRGSRRVSLPALRKATWLLREPGSGTREIVDQWLIPRLHHLHAAIELGSSEAIKRAAAGGLGIACLSRYVVQDLLESGDLVALETELPRLTRQLYLVLHGQKKETHGLELLLRHVMGMQDKRAD